MAIDHRLRSAALAEKFWQVNWLLLLVVTAIASVGVAALYSVAGGSFEPWAERHALRVAVGIAIAITVALTPLRFWLAIAYPAYALALILLILVPLFGTAQMGARRWLGVGIVSFQPSELMKLALVLCLARYYHSLPAARVSEPLRVAVPLAMIAGPAALVLRQPDLGTAVLLIAVGLGLMFLAGVKLRYFLAGAGLAVGAMPLIWSRLHDYQKRRIATFLDPDHDPLGAGYHILQSKIALGSGGLEGKGFMLGTQSKLDFLPEKHTDFIFTMFAEEMGFAGSAALLAAYGLLLFLLLAMAVRAQNSFARLLIGGATLTAMFYVFVNIAMVTGLAPVVGVPLPLVSYGGTAMLTMLMAIGLAMCADVHRGEALRRENWALRW